MRKLNQNYRNTQEILSAAWELVQSSSVEEDDEAFPLVEPSTTLRRGKRPTLQLCENRLPTLRARSHKFNNLLAGRDILPTPN